MEITEIPVTEYLKHCMNSAREKGFLWVMILLARERDSPKSYEDLCQYWESYNNLTGETILFLLSAPGLQKEVTEKRLLCLGDCSWRGFTNRNIVIVNQNDSTFGVKHILKSRSAEYRKQAVQDNTRYITELCTQLNISEKSVPALVMISTSSDENISPVVIPLSNDNAYDTIRQVIEAVEAPMREYMKHERSLKEYYYIRNNQKAVTNLSSKERKFLEAKERIEDALEKTNNPEEKALLLSAYNQKDKHVCHHFPQPLRAALNRYIDTLSEDTRFEEHIKEKQEAIKTRKIECERLDVSIRFEQVMILRYKNEVDRCIGELSEKYSTKDNGVIMSDLPHFRIGISYSGTIEETFVLPACSALLKLGYSKDDIFFAPWHHALTNGANADRRLRKIYHDHCDIVVVFLSQDYPKKPLPGSVEWQAISDRIYTEDSTICLLKVGDFDVEKVGLYNTEAITEQIIDLNSNEVAKFIHKYYTQRYGGVPKSGVKRSK